MTPTSSKAIVTMGLGPHAELLELSLPTMQRLATRHGYDVVVGDGSTCAGRPASWGKVPLCRALLEDYDTVLWLDADLVVLRFGDDPSAGLPSDAYQGLVFHPWAGKPVPGMSWHGYEIPNMGVWLLRGARAQAFLDAVWACEEYVNNGWWENAAVIHLLEADPLWRDGTYHLDGRWNRVRLTRATASIRHFAGRSHDDRLREMAYYGSRRGRIRQRLREVVATTRRR